MESLISRDFLAQLGRKISTLRSEEEGETCRVLVTSHGGLIKELNLVLVKEFACEMPCAQGEYGRICPNTGVTKFTIAVDGEGKIRRAKCSLLYYKDHLKGLEFHEPVHYGV